MINQSSKANFRVLSTLEFRTLRAITRDGKVREGSPAWSHRAVVALKHLGLLQGWEEKRPRAGAHERQTDLLISLAPDVDFSMRGGTLYVYLRDSLVARYHGVGPRVARDFER